MADRALGGRPPEGFWEKDKQGTSSKGSEEACPVPVTWSTCLCLCGSSWPMALVGTPGKPAHHRALLSGSAEGGSQFKAMTRNIPTTWQLVIPAPFRDSRLEAAVVVVTFRGLLCACAHHQVVSFTGGQRGATMKPSEDAGLPWQLPPSAPVTGHTPIFQPSDPFLHLASQLPVYKRLLDCV